MQNQTCSASLPIYCTEGEAEQKIKALKIGSIAREMNQRSDDDGGRSKG
jgi:hypothetical protein